MLFVIFFQSAPWRNEAAFSVANMIEASAGVARQMRAVAREGNEQVHLMKVLPGRNFSQ